MEFYKRFEQLCAEEGLKPQSKEMLEITGVSSPAISNWNLKGSLPKADVLIRLADHFQVSVDYLLGLSEVRFQSNNNSDSSVSSPSASSSVNDAVISDRVLSDQEKLLIRLFREANASGQFQIIHTCMAVRDRAGESSKESKRSPTTDRTG